MRDQPKYAYLYDKQNKIETICSVNQKHNYWEAKTDAEKIARKVLPKSIEEYHLLEVKKQMPFGSFLSDILSINFIDDPHYMQDRAKTVEDLFYWLIKLENFLEDISLQYLWDKPLDWEANKDDVKRLYMIRKYIDMCIERPRLYSFGQFQQLLKPSTNMAGIRKHLVSLHLLRQQLGNYIFSMIGRYSLEWIIAFVASITKSFRV